MELTKNITWKGYNSEVNIIVGMEIGKNHLKIPFETYKDKVLNYVISNYTNGGYMKPIFRKLGDPIPKQWKTSTSLQRLDDVADQIEKDIQRERIKQLVSREYVLRINIEKLYGLLWGKYSSALQATIKGTSKYKDKSENFGNVIWLLTEIKIAIYGIDLKDNPRLTLHEVVSTLYKFSKVK